MKTTPRRYYTPRQGQIPVFVSDFLSISDPVLAFDRFMEGIDLSKYLKNVPEYITGRNRYNPVDMLKTVLFAFADNGYCSLRKLEDNCKVNMRYMYLMNWKTPSYRTFGYFINEVLAESIEAIFRDINLAIFAQEKVDLSHLYIDGTKLEANANKYSWVWKKATEKSRYRLFAKITALLDEINEELSWSGLRIPTRSMCRNIWPKCWPPTRSFISWMKPTLCMAKDAAKRSGSAITSAFRHICASWRNTVRS